MCHRGGLLPEGLSFFITPWFGSGLSSKHPLRVLCVPATDIMKLPRWEMDGPQWLRCCWYWRHAQPHQLNRWGDDEGDNVASVWLKTNEAAAVMTTVSWKRVSPLLNRRSFFHFFKSSVELRGHKKKCFCTLHLPFAPCRMSLLVLTARRP